MRTSIISAVTLACLAHALPQGGPPVQPPTTTTDPTGPPTNPPDAGGGGGGGGWHGPGGRSRSFGLVLEVEKWDDMNGRFLRPEYDAAKGIYYLTPNLNGETPSRHFRFTTMGEGVSVGNVGYSTDRGAATQWTGILSSDRTACPPNFPILVADANSTTMWWVNDGVWVDPSATTPPTGPPTTAPTGPGDGSYWRRQVDWREDRRCRRGGPGGGGGGPGGNDDPQDKFVICWVTVKDQFSGPRTPPLNRMALHWHNGKMDDLDTKKCWPAKVKMATFRGGPGGGN